MGIRRARPVLLLHPAILCIFAFGLPLALSASVSPENYRALWRVRKYVDSDFVAVGLLLLLALVSGTILGARSRWAIWSRRTGTDPRLFVRAASAGRLLLLTGLAAYVLQWLVAVGVRGLRPDSIVAALSGNSIALQTVKASLRPIGGITTFNQLVGVGAAFAVFARKTTGLWSYRNRLLVLLGGSASLVRAMLYAERLAVLEFAIPVLVTLVLTRYTVRTGAVTTGSPAIGLFERIKVWLLLASGAALFLVLYSYQEYYRKWVPYYSLQYQGTFAGYIRDRFTGYYATALNNAALLDDLGQPPIGYALLRVPREIPGVEAIELPGSTFRLGPVLETYANPEFNNTGGVMGLYAEVGLWSVLLVFAGAFLVGKCYQRATERNSVFCCVYGVSVVPLLEASRIPYLLYPRGLVPVLAAIIAAVWITRPGSHQLDAIPQTDPRRRRYKCA